MKRLLLLATAILYLNIVPAQKFDIADFNEKLETTEWLYTYDKIAWWSTDFLMTKEQEKIKLLGREWFCFQDSLNVWHSVYGKYLNGQYNQIFHFIVNAKNDIQESPKQIDKAFLNSHGKALQKSFKQMKSIKDSTSIRFNHYIKKNGEGNFDIYIFPGFQKDGTAIYGGEFIYEISPSNEIINDRSYFQGQFRGFKTDPPREIGLNYRELEKPTLGSVFFAWYYKDYFTEIHIDNKESFSLPLKDGKNFTWLNVEKNLKKEAREKRKRERKKKKR